MLVDEFRQFFWPKITNFFVVFIYLCVVILSLMGAIFFGSLGERVQHVVETVKVAGPIA